MSFYPPHTDVWRVPCRDLDLLHNAEGLVELITFVRAPTQYICTKCKQLVGGTAGHMEQHVLEVHSKEKNEGARGY